MSAASRERASDSNHFQSDSISSRVKTRPGAAASAGRGSPERDCACASAKDPRARAISAIATPRLRRLTIRAGGAASVTPTPRSSWNVSCPPTANGADTIASLQAEGQTVVYVLVEDRIAGILGIADPVKPTSVDAIRQLRAAGLRVLMLTGDSVGTARAVAAAVGIDEVQADVLPADKARVVEQLQAAVEAEAAQHRPHRRLHRKL